MLWGGAAPRPDDRLGHFLLSRVQVWLELQVSIVSCQPNACTGADASDLVPSTLPKPLADDRSVCISLLPADLISARSGGATGGGGLLRWEA